MCGFAGELRRDGAPDRAALARMQAVLAPRGPDGERRCGSTGRVGLAHRRLAIIDLSRARRAADGRRGARPRGRLQRLHLQPPRAARGAGARRARRSPPTSDTEVLLKGWAEWGEGMLDRLAGMFAFALWRARRAGGSCSRATGSASSRCTWCDVPDGAPALRLDAAGAAWPAAASTPRSTRSRCTTTSPCTRSSRRRARSCAACASCRPRRCWSSSRTARGASGAGGTRRSRATRRAPAGARREWEEALLDALRDGGRPAHGRRRPGRRAALGRAGLLADRRAARRAAASASWRRSRSASATSATARGTSSRSPTSSRASSARSTTRSASGPTGCVDALPAAIAAMSEPMVSHDAVAFYLLSEEVARDRKVVQSGQGADEVLGGYYWYPPMLDAPRRRARHVRGRVLRPRRRRGRRRWWRPTHRAVRRPDARLRRRVVRRAGRGRAGRPRAADRRRADARRRPGQARRHHDDGARARGAHAVPRPRPRRARGAVPARAQARRRRQGRAQARRARRRARRGDRPAEGLLPGARARRTSRARCSSWCATRSPRARRATAGCSDPATVDAMLADPNAHRTNLDGSSLWQLGLLELWLQAHVG